VGRGHGHEKLPEFAPNGARAPEPPLRRALRCERGTGVVASLRRSLGVARRAPGLRAYPSNLISFERA
jgi:hypothetical protein